MLYPCSDTIFRQIYPMRMSLKGLSYQIRSAWKWNCIEPRSWCTARLNSAAHVLNHVILKSCEVKTYIEVILELETWVKVNLWERYFNHPPNPLRGVYWAKKCYASLDSAWHVINHVKLKLVLKSCLIWKLGSGQTYEKMFSKHPVNLTCWRHISVDISGSETCNQRCQTFVSMSVLIHTALVGVFLSKEVFFVSCSVLSMCIYNGLFCFCRVKINHMVRFPVLYSMCVYSLIWYGHEQECLNRPRLGHKKLDFKNFLQITFVIVMATLTLTNAHFLRKAARVDTFRFKITIITSQNSDKSAYICHLFLVL
jgi:hypothetical protein